MRRSTWIAAAVLGASGAITVWSAGSAERGAAVFQQMCTGCHATDANKEGPRLRGVIARGPGAVPGFPYSEGLKKARLAWNDATLDQWLTDPSTVVPDNEMAFRLDDAGKRADIIAYLKTLK